MECHDIRVEAAYHPTVADNNAGISTERIKNRVMKKDTADWHKNYLVIRFAVRKGNPVRHVWRIVAKEVINGKWRVGKERHAKLEAAGYDYVEVQKKIYAMMKYAR